MLGLAVGIDYALFILSRHRQNLAEGMPAREAAARATATAGSAVVFAGLTVIIALVGLTVVNIPFLTVMGLAAAGHRRDRRADRDHAAARDPRLRRRPRGAHEPRARLPPARGVASGRATLERPLGDGSSPAARWPSLLAGLALLGAIAIPATAHEARPARRRLQPTTSTERRAYDLLTDGFGPGFNGPLTVVVDAPGLDREPAEADRQRASSTGSRAARASPRSAPAVQNEAGDLTIVSVTPTSGPASEETKDLVAADPRPRPTRSRRRPASRPTSPARRRSTSTPPTG